MEECFSKEAVKEFESEWIRATVIMSSMQMLRPEGEIRMACFREKYARGLLPVIHKITGLVEMKLTIYKT